MRTPFVRGVSLVLGALVLPSVVSAQARVGPGGADRTVGDGVVVYTGVTLIDGTGAAAQSGVSIVVEDGRITDIGVDAAASTSDAEVVDASGLYVIPGLIEGHTHLATMAARERAQWLLNRYIYAGITTARDMAGDARSLADLQRAALVGEIAAPDIHYSALLAGPSFWSDPRTISTTMGEAPGQVPWTQTVTDETDLRETISIARGTWATGIKTYASIEGELLADIVVEARRQGIPVWSHTHVGPARPLEVARTGVTSMSHVCSLAAAAIPDDVFADGQAGRRSGFVDVDLDSPRIDDVLEIMSARGIVLDATLWVMVQMANRPPPPARPEPEPEPDEPRPADVRRRGVRGQCDLEDAHDLTRRAYEAGVLISAGTDGTTPPTDEWPALFSELTYLHEEIGMPMVDVLKAASINNAIALGLDDEIGTVEPGKYANLVFLREDPLSGPDALKSIAYTIKRGRVYQRDDFELGTLPSPDRSGSPN